MPTFFIHHADLIVLATIAVLRCPLRRCAFTRAITTPRHQPDVHRPPRPPCRADVSRHRNATGVQRGRSLHNVSPCIRRHFRLLLNATPTQASHSRQTTHARLRRRRSPLRQRDCAAEAAKRVKRVQTQMKAMPPYEGCRLFIIVFSAFFF